MCEHMCGYVVFLLSTTYTHACTQVKGCTGEFPGYFYISENERRALKGVVEQAGASKRQREVYVVLVVEHATEPNK